MTSKPSLATLFIFLFAIANFSAFTQNFEGWILYKTEVLNPMPEKIPDSSWKKEMKVRLGERSYFLQKYFYKKDNYKSEIDIGTQNGYQVYDKKNNLLYAWKDKSDTVVTRSTLKNPDDFLELQDIDKPDTILGIPCKAILIHSMFGKMTIWYNSDHLKLDPAFFAGHKYGFWEQIVAKTGALPLKIEQRGFMIHTMQTVIEYKNESIPDSKFEIPKFKTVLNH